MNTKTYNRKFTFSDYFFLGLAILNMLLYTHDILHYERDMLGILITYIFFLFIFGYKVLLIILIFLKKVYICMEQDRLILKENIFRKTIILFDDVEEIKYSNAMGKFIYIYAIGYKPTLVKNVIKGDFEQFYKDLVEKINETRE